MRVKKRARAPAHGRRGFTPPLHNSRAHVGAAHSKEIEQRQHAKVKARDGWRGHCRPDARPDVGVVAACGRGMSLAGLPGHFLTARGCAVKI